MKVYPTNKKNRPIKPGERNLTATEKVTKIIAILVAMGTVYFFFFKILFF